jgi:hypothetical protein
VSVERDYRITISAMLGRGMSAAMTDFVAEATRAKAKVDEILAKPNKGAAKAAAEEGKVRVTEAQKAAAELAKIREKENDAILKDVAKHEKAQEKAQAKIAKIKERYFQEEQRRGEKADAERERRNEKIASSAMGYMRKAAAVAGRVAGELTSGFGVNFDVSGAMQRGANVDETARKATISGKGALGQNASEADVQQTIATIRAAGDASKQSYGALATGLEQFVSKSSDLATGEKVLSDLGRIARATGTDVNDLVSAAGDVNKTLDDTPDKAEKLLDIMTLVATQSAKGSVEVKDFARYMGRVTAGAFKFEGSKAENIGILAGMAQVAMKGGASGAREATNAAQAFSNDITKGKALKGFESAGIDVFANKEKTQLRSPEKIITDFLRMSKGDLSQLSKLFPNEGSKRVVTGFSSIYTGAGGGDAGIAAVRAEFKKFAETMSASDIKQRADLSGEGRAAKAQEFQNKLDTIVDSMATRVLPAFEKLAPSALIVADALAGIVTSAAEHPWSAVASVIGASLAASIAKATIGDIVGKSIASAMGAFGPAGIAVGLLAVAAAAAAAAISDYETKSDKSKDKFDKDIPALVARAQKQLKETGTIDKDTIDEIARRRAEVEGVRQTADKTTLGTDKLSYSQLIAAKITGGADQVADAEGSLAAGQDKGKLDKQAASLDALLEEIKGLRQHTKDDSSKTKKVQIVGGLPGAGVAAPTDGTVPN